MRKIGIYGGGAPPINTEVLRKICLDRLVKQKIYEKIGVYGGHASRINTEFLGPSISQDRQC